MQVTTSKLLTLILSATLFSFQAIARPTVGLVLSGGGARGAAHVGVLKVLEELRIPVDVVAGTSMGSIVGGLYASGMSVAEIEQTINSLNWDYLLEDDPGRANLSLNRKIQEDLFSTEISPGYNNGSVQLRPGLITGQKVELVLQRLTTQVAHISDFDDLPIPFRAVAADIVTGETVVLKSGNLGRAMRASMSVPTIFAPVEVDGRILVDGGIADNLPVDVARQMGADVLIVVDVGSPLRNKDQITNALTVTDQLTRLLTGRNVIASLSSISADDILIKPILGSITAIQFDRAAEAVPLGEAAAREASAELLNLSLSVEDFASYQANLNRVPSGDRTVRSISLDNRSNVADEVLQKRIDVKTGETLSLDQLEENIGRMHSIGIFEKVGYDLVQHRDGVDIDLFATPKSWGPNYLHFGMSVDGYFDGDNSANLILGYTRTDLNKWAGDWTTLLQLGDEPRFLSYFHQPLGVDLKYFVQPSIDLKKTNWGVFNDGDKIAEYRLVENELEFLIGKDFGTRAALALGLSRINGEIELFTGDPTLPEEQFDDGGIIVRFRYDTIDDIDFPSTGNEIRASYYQAHESLGADEDYIQWRLRLNGFRSFGKHTVGLGMKVGGIEDGTASLSRRLFLGGFFNISGLKPNERFGQYLGIVGAVYYRRYDRIKFLSAYLGGTVEYGGVWDDTDDISSENSLFAGSLFIGLDSPLGPILVGWAYTDEGDDLYFIKLGRFF
ncbi:MAG: patatin-like phospholipase family protein [Verrucomicrobia bacterium]|nr:patatin-like phospholipase family protein [Verrucomicrobiota bacterium]